MGEHRKKAQRSPLIGPAPIPWSGQTNQGLGELPQFGRGLLASSHAGTRLPIAVPSGPDTGRSPSVRPRPVGRAACGVRHIPSEEVQKNRASIHGRPRIVSGHMTTYGGITHIRSKGRSAQLPLSPLLRAPLSCGHHTPICSPCQGGRPPGGREPPLPGRLEPAAAAPRPPGRPSPPAGPETLGAIVANL